MTANEIITNIFQVYLDDTTELSQTEELALLNRVYQKICGLRHWEFLKKPATGTTSTSVSHISLPADFYYMAEDKGEKIIYVGTELKRYKAVNFSDRRKYRNKEGFYFIDLANQRIVFTRQPTTAETYEFDYIYMPPQLTINQSPVLPENFHPMIGFGMAVDGFIIQLFDKARSYAGENQAKYNDYLRDLIYWDSQIISL